MCQLPLLSSRGLRLAREGRRVWPIDCCPADVLRRVQVGVGREPHATPRNFAGDFRLAFSQCPQREQVWLV